MVYMAGGSTRASLFGCLSRVTGNYHIQFLGGLGLATAPGYPVNRIMDPKYKQRRKEFEKRFQSYEPVPNSEKVVRSPSGVYGLTMTKYTAGPSTRNFSRGVVRKIERRRPIADIKRNYGMFWHAWVQHPNGNEYLLCGEDYQGYTVINLTHERIQTYFLERGYDGFGFCCSSENSSVSLTNCGNLSRGVEKNTHLIMRGILEFVVNRVDC